MARLPDSTVLGGIDLSPSRRPVASYDVSGYGEGGQEIARSLINVGSSLTKTGQAQEAAGTAFATGVAGIGKGLQVAGKEFERQAEDQTRFELAQARSDFLVNKVNYDASAENYSPDKYRSGLNDIAKAASDKIGNERARQLFDLSVADDIARGAVAAQKRGESRARDALAASAQTSLDNLRQAGLKSADPVERAKIIDQASGLIDSMASRNLITRESAVNMKRDWSKNFAIGAIGMLDPGERVNALNSDTALTHVLPEDVRVRMRNDAQREVDATAAKQAQTEAQAHERSLIDAAAGIGQLPPRSLIENDPILDEAHRNTLLRQYDHAAGQVVQLQQFTQKFNDPNGGPFNPYDKDQRNMADNLYRAMGSDEPALRAITERTGILPESAASAMRGNLISNDPARVAATLTVASNMKAKNENIFVGTPGQKEVEDATVTFRHLKDDYGMSDDQAAREIIKQQTDEYKVKTAARVKSEDINNIIKNNLSTGDLSSQFSSILPGTFIGRVFGPTVGETPAQRERMFELYKERFAEHYMVSGDVGDAKAKATNDLRMNFGVSHVTGSSVFMEFPPERAAAYAQYPAAEISKQATQAIKDSTGQDIPADKIIWTPIPGVTGQVYRTGQPVPYSLMWYDEKGNLQQPREWFVADPAKMGESVQQQQQQKFERARKIKEFRSEEPTLSAPFNISPTELAGIDIASRIAESMPPINAKNWDAMLEEGGQQPHTIIDRTGRSNKLPVRRNAVR